MALTGAGWMPKSGEDTLTPQYPDVGKCQHLLCKPCAALAQQLLGLDQHL